MSGPSNKRKEIEQVEYSASGSLVTEASSNSGSNSRLRVKISLSGASSSVVSVPIARTEEMAVDQHAEKKHKKEKKSKKEKQAKIAKVTESVSQKMELFGNRDFCGMELKQEHATKPVWVTADGHIFLETSSPVYQQAYDFLIAIAEPECRASLVQEYQLTRYSLYAAAAVGLSTDKINKALNMFSKVVIPQSLKQFISECTMKFGKVKLVLQKNRHFVEATPDLLMDLLSRKEIKKAYVDNPTDVTIDEKTGLVITRAPTTVRISGGVIQNNAIDATLEQADPSTFNFDDEEEHTFKEVHSFEIDSAMVEPVKKFCEDIGFPMLEEYDFKNDMTNPNLQIELKPTTIVRPYQEKSLSKMFSNGRARSGIIVLPCGAGKSLVGVTAASTIQKSCIVLCNSGMSVNQWRDQFLLWTNLDPKYVTKFTSDSKEAFTNPCVLVTTYNMIAFSGKRSAESQKIMDEISKREWGLIILDEVHIVPASMFRKVLSLVHTHCKLGLTATLVREDDKIGDLNFLIGPKMYEANWMDLQKQGYIANVQCAEVWCSMTPEFYRSFLEGSLERKRLLYGMNPTKFRYCQFLIHYHEARGDKIIVFSDNIYVLESYARKMKKFYIYGKTTPSERASVLSKFKCGLLNTIFLSKVGDTSIDLPDATVIIQISSHFGARRQEAQRLGRILRPKPNCRDEFNAFFYTLVSKDTEEMYYSTKRQQYLIDQGYSFKVISELPIGDDPNLDYSTKEEQLNLLADVLKVSEDAAKDEEIADEDSLEFTKAKPAQRRSGNSRALSGGEGLMYSEYRTQPANTIFSKPAVKVNLLQQLNKKR